MTLPLFLHVGCGPHSKSNTPFADKPWDELRLDIDSSVEPDVVGTMAEMSAVADESVDAIYSSHNIEHLYPHEVPIAFQEFRRVLKPNGFVLLTCPDLQSACKLVVEDKLCDPAYMSLLGPISPVDIIYGLRTSMQNGNLYMAHRCGFTGKVLSGTFREAGFACAVRARPQVFDLWAIGAINQTEEWFREKVQEFFPG